MKIALISYDAFQGNSTGLYPPLHLCNLATVLRLNDFEVKIFDYASPFSKIDGFLKEIKDYQPDLAGLTCYTPYVARFHQITKRLREFIPKAAMVVGGPHPSVWPEWTLKNMPQFDYAMQGECDLSTALLSKMVDGKCLESDVPGIAYRSGDKVIINERDYVDNLNDLPQVDRSFLERYYNDKMYWDMAAGGKLDMMITSRGCPYNCSFCFKVEKKYRFRNVEHLMIEFEELKRRGVKSIHIQDDAFTANKKRCMEIAENLSKGKYRFELKVRSRVNSIDEEVLRKLKRAGVREIIYGFESGSQIILDSMNKKTTVKMNIKAITLTKKVGIGCYGEIMIGMPGETKDTINETINFLLKTKPIVGFVPVLYPLPGTKVYEDAKNNGSLQGDWTIDGAWPWVKLPWTQSSKELYAESWRISKTIQRDPRTILYFLKLHLKTMSWNQFLFLFRLLKRHISS